MGRTWSPPIDTGHPGQAAGLISIGDNLLLTVCAQRAENPGLWVRMINFRNDRWQVLAEAEIYKSTYAAQTYAGQPAAEMFRSLRFGQPSLLALDNGDVLATHWCVEDGQGKIRSHRLRIRV